MKRQSNPLAGLMGSLGGSLGSASKPSKILSLTPEINNLAKRDRIIWGPFDFAAANVSVSFLISPFPLLTPISPFLYSFLKETQLTTPQKSTTKKPAVPGMQMDPNGQVLMKRLSGFCSDCNVVHGSAFIANADGSRVDVKDGAYLHHLLVLSTQKRVGSYYNCSRSDSADSATPGFPSSYFLGSGVDQSEYYFTTPDGKYNSGYYIGKNEQFLMQTEIVNYSPKPQKWYIAADVEYTAGRPEGAEDVSVTDFNVVSCSGFLEAGYHPPNGEAKFAKTSPKFIMSRDGTILHAMGHLHDGGTNIQLLLNGKLVCDSVATYGGPRGTFLNGDGSKWETISSMSSCRDPIRVKKGDVMTLVSVYDTDLHPL